MIDWVSIPIVSVTIYSKLSNPCEERTNEIHELVELDNIIEVVNLIHRKFTYFVIPDDTRIVFDTWYSILAL